MPAVVWWSPTDEEDDKAVRAKMLIDETRSIEDRQAAWHSLNLWNSTLYTNRELVGFRWGETVADVELWPTNLRTENIVEEIGESFLSKASSSPIRPALVPHGRSWKVERAVRKLDEFMQGLWEQTRAEDACIQMFGDAYTSGLGCVETEWDDETKTLSSSAVFFDNLIIDNRECTNRQMPRTYRIRMVLPRTAVEARYGVDLDPKLQGQYVSYRQVATDWVVVVKAWHLPDAKGKGGRFSIAAAGQMLRDEEWNHDWVPLSFFHWQDRRSGFFTKSGIEQVVPYQVRQNELNDAIELSQDLVCRPRILQHAGSQIDYSQWDNEAGRFLLYSGVKPEPFVWQTDLPTLLAERERNKAAAYSHVAISEMYGNADLPPGVRMDSSAAVREVRNMEDSRHLRMWTNFEYARLDVSRKQLLMLSIHPNADALTSVYHPPRSKASAKSIPWKEVKTLTSDKYSWTLEATSKAASSAAARRELIRDWASRVGTPDALEEAKRMLNNSNLEWMEELETAAADDILRHIDIMEEGGFEAPTEITDCNLGTYKVAANYHRLKDYEDVDPIVLQNHLRWLVKAQTITQQAISVTQQLPFSPTQGMMGTNAAMGGGGASPQPQMQPG